MKKNFTMQPLRDQSSWQPLWDYLESQGFDKRPFPTRLIGFLSLRFSGYGSLDKAFLDLGFREACHNYMGVPLPFHTVCSLEDDTYRIICYAQLLDVVTIEREGKIVYRARPEDVASMADFEMQLFREFAEEVGLEKSVTARRLKELEGYLLSDRI